MQFMSGRGAALTECDVAYVGPGRDAHRVRCGLCRAGARPADPI